MFKLMKSPLLWQVGAGFGLGTMVFTAIDPSNAIALHSFFAHLEG